MLFESALMVACISVPWTGGLALTSAPWVAVVGVSLSLLLPSPGPTSSLCGRQSQAGAQTSFSGPWTGHGSVRFQRNGPSGYLGVRRQSKTPPGTDGTAAWIVFHGWGGGCPFISADSVWEDRDSTTSRYQCRLWGRLTLGIECISCLSK